MARLSRISIAPPGTKYCPKCSLFKPMSDWQQGASYCKPCMRKYRRENDSYKNQYERYLQAAHEHYGDSCAICGEEFKPALVIDPLEGAGQFATLKYVKAREYPDGYRFVCFNCREKIKRGAIDADGNTDSG